VYEAICKVISVDEANVDTSAIQYALEGLRDKLLIWKSSRGVYAIEDTQHTAWLIEDAREQNLPPPPVPGGQPADPDDEGDGEKETPAPGQ
jgi:hypothetical protein